MATLLVAVGAALALVLIKRVPDPDYWIAGIAVVLPLVLGLIGQARRPSRSPTADPVDAEIRNLREMVHNLWDTEIRQRKEVTLQVPFTTATEITGPLMVPVYDKRSLLPVLENGKPKLEAKERTVPIMVTWDLILDQPDQVPPPLEGRFDDFVGAFTSPGMPDRLVILGEPGSGKSILAQHLTVALTKPGTAEGRVPVVIPLATWDPAVPLLDWAAGQITQTYQWLAREVQGEKGVGRSMARAMLDQRKIMMILDGLDEVEEANRAAAFRKLCQAAVDNRPMVVTCRATDYAQIVFDAKRGPMERTPVIQLHPLPLDDIRNYLGKVGKNYGGIHALINQLAVAPDGPLAQALRTPLALWLVTRVYRGRPAARLTESKNSKQILEHLHDALVTSVYSAPVMGTDYPGYDVGDPVIKTARSRLAKLANYLGPDPNRQNIDWWRLPEEVPSLFIGCIIGGAVGAVLGGAVGYATAIRFTSHLGLIFGILFGVATGILAGVTSVRPQDHPRTISLRPRWNFWRFVGCLAVGVAVGVTAGYSDAVHGGLAAGLITGAVVGPVCALPCIGTFGAKPGVTAGAASALAMGLSSGLSAGNGHPAVSGGLAGLVWAGAAWVFVGLFQPAEEKFVVTPETLLDRDQTGSLIVAATAGIGFAVVFGVALGPLVGLVALGSLFVAVILTVSMWGAFNISRVWLAATGMTPLTVMAFFREAYARGVFRQVGGSYQFRHTELKEALIRTSAPEPLADIYDFDTASGSVGR